MVQRIVGVWRWIHSSFLTFLVPHVNEYSIVTSESGRGSTGSMTIRARPFMISASIEAYLDLIFKTSVVSNGDFLISTNAPNRTSSSYTLAYPQLVISKVFACGRSACCMEYTSAWLGNPTSKDSIAPRRKLNWPGITYSPSASNSGHQNTTLVSGVSPNRANKNSISGAGSTPLKRNSKQVVSGLNSCEP